jgi:hypothetical protein
MSARICISAGTGRRSLAHALAGAGPPIGCPEPVDTPTGRGWRANTYRRIAYNRPQAGGFTARLDGRRSGTVAAVK